MRFDMGDLGDSAHANSVSQCGMQNLEVIWQSEHAPDIQSEHFEHTLRLHVYRSQVLLHATAEMVGQNNTSQKTD